MKVLHIFGIMDRGGAEMRTVELMPLLSKKGVHFDYFVLKNQRGALDEKIERLGGRVFRCPLRPNPFAFAFKFVKFLRQSNYDIVHSHSHYFNGFILWLAYLGRIRARIAHFRSISDGKGNGLGRILYHGFMRFLINKYATKILAVCRGAMASGWRTDWQSDSRCKIIYNGLDLSGYRNIHDARSSVTAELGLKEDAQIIINVGSFNPAKAHDVLLHSFARINKDCPETILLLAGAARDGNLFEETKDLAKKLAIDDKVIFLGSRSDIPRLLKASDCFILSSRREGLPGVVLEAIAAGLPVVATDLPGVREIAEHTKSISIVPVENPAEISKKATEILKNIPQHQIISADFPEVFDLQVCAQSLYDVYVEQVGCTNDRKLTKV